MKTLFAKKVVFALAISGIVFVNDGLAANETAVESITDKSFHNENIKEIPEAKFTLDSIESIDKCISAAEAGNVNAQLKLGLNYGKLEERSTVLDYTEAAKWLKKAAKQKNPVALFQLGFLYQKGFGVNKDEVAAAKLYRAAADLGLADAKCALATCYMYSIGVPQNYKQAILWYTDAAKQGHKLAQYKLGLIYMTGNNALACDQIMAYMLLSMAKSTDDWFSRDAADKLGFLSTHMRMAQIAEAERKGTNPSAALSDALSDQIGQIAPADHVL
jgi:TPR repeat protein